MKTRKKILTSLQEDNLDSFLKELDVVLLEAQNENKDITSNIEWYIHISCNFNSIKIFNHFWDNAHTYLALPSIDEAREKIVFNNHYKNPANTGDYILTRFYPYIKKSGQKNIHHFFQTSLLKNFTDFSLKVIADEDIDQKTLQSWLDNPLYRNRNFPKVVSAFQKRLLKQSLPSKPPSSSKKI